MDDGQYSQQRISEANSRRQSIIENKKVFSQSNLPQRLNALNLKQTKQQEAKINNLHWCIEKA